MLYFYPRPPRGGRPDYLAFPQAGGIISIHALREEGDAALAQAERVRAVFLSTPSARRATLSGLPALPRTGISIHALREEGDIQAIHRIYRFLQFLSTPSARRATDHYSMACVYRAISIHALREEGDGYREGVAITWTYFYPRPPRGGRLPLSTKAVAFQSFLSTPSARRATRADALELDLDKHFYPRPPRGGRHFPLIFC